MKNFRKFVSVLALIVLVGSEFLTSISYALDDMLDDSVVVQIENEEAESVENEEENVDKEDSETVYEDENMEEEKLETENSAGDIIEEWTGKVSEIGSGEVKELAEETVEGITGDLEGVTGDVEELTGEVVESTEIGEETVIEDMTYNEEPITGEKTYNDVTVRVEALTGIFPERTELKIEPIKWWNLSSLKDKLVEEQEEIKEDATIVAFDITFKYEGEEVQPKDGEKVKVTFDYSRNEDLVKADKNENQEVKVYHIENKDEEGNDVAQGEEKVVDVTNKEESLEEGIAVADAESFSVYLVTYGNEDPEYTATLFGDDTARNNFHYKTITISDGTHTYTLMDRNLGARVAWDGTNFAVDNSGNYNTASDYYGYYYQWGNSYGFSAKTTSADRGEVISNAIPSNYVSSAWAIFWTPPYDTGPFPRELGYNLRGNTTNTESARQGPCPRGWHVPSVDEWEAIRDAWCISAGKGEDCIAGQGFAEALKMPTAGYRYYKYGKFIYSLYDNGIYWSSTLNYLSKSPTLKDSEAYYLSFNSRNINSNSSSHEEVDHALSVRCLKNNTDAVTLYLNPNGGKVGDGIKDADAQGNVTLPTATKNEYNFDGWYDAVDGGNRRGGSGDEITINEDTDLYAHWSEIIPNPIVTFNNGADVTEFEVESGGTLTNEQIQQILNLTHTKATFDGWYTNPEFNQAFDFNSPITEDISLYAKWTCKPGYTTLKGNGGPDMNCFEYGTISYEDTDGNGHVLMDRNLGAQMIGFLYDADPKSYGYYYQWGNNYGFGPSIAPITSNTQVDCTNINPSTYSSSTFIMGSNDFDWCSSRNNNLWGGENDNENNGRGLDLNNLTDRQGPCPNGWHVPSIGERQTLLIYWASLNNVTLKSGIPFDYYVPSYNGDYVNYNEFKAEFKIPIAGHFHYMVAQLGGNGGGGSANLWSSSSDINMRARQLQLTMNGAEITANGRDNRAIGESIRCFMNNPKIVTFNYNGGVGENFEINIPSGTKVTAPDDPTNGDQIFVGWYASTDGGQTLSATAFDFNEEITKNVNLYAKWVSCGDGEIFSPELGKCVARWHELVSLTDDNTTTTVGLDEPVDGLPTTITVIENNILELPEGEALSEAEGKELVGDITIDFGGENAKFSRLVKVKIPVEGSSKAYVKVKHVGSDEYNYDGLTRYIEASCDDGNIENLNDKYHGEYMDVESGYVSIYTCEASDFAAFGLPKVTFEPNNGDDPIIVEVESGAMVSSEDIPTVTKSGYNFSGWYLTGAESAFDFSGTAITGDITLYAKWQEDEGVTYTVTFDANRGTFADTPASQNVLGGGHATDPAMFSGYNEPKLPGYAFTGWWTEPRGGTQWNFANDTVTGNITLYAHWTYKEIFGDLDVYMIDSNGSLIKYVMMDRNMGATGVYNKNFDSQNPNSFGFVYQWGNNYGFPRCNGNATCNYSPITDTPVSVDIVENYIPSKFASSTWIGKNGSNGSKKSWYVSDNTLNHLWGNGNTIDMQGPCPDGYHVPLTSETNDEGGLFRVWGDIYDKTINTIAGKGEGISFISDDQKLFTFQFLFPHAGNHKKGNTKEQEQNMCGDYWTATPSGTENAINIWFCKDGDNSSYNANGNFLFTNNSQRNNGSTLRCFKNSTGSANLDIVNGGKKGLITIDKVDGVATINAIKEPENTDANGTGLIFGGWYTSPNFEPTTMKTGGDTLSDSVTALYAKWDCPDGLVYNSDNECISGVLVRFMDGETEYTRSVVLSGEEVSAPAINPIKAGHIFTGWFESGANLPFVFTGTPITGNLDLYAHWDVLPQTEALITVNYYLKKLDVENNELTGGVIVYSTGVEFIGEIGDTLNISGTYLTGIVGYYYDHATVFSGEDEILADEIYLEGNKEINMYYIPEQNQFTLNTVPYSSTEGSSTGGMYYYGAKVILSGASSDDHYLWSGWIGLPGGTPNSAQTEFYMPNSAVSVTSSVREKIYNEYTVTFENRNGSVLWSGKVISGEIPVYSGNTPLRPATEETVFTFEGWYPEINPVTGNTTYIAVYTESPRSYTVTLTGTPAGYGTLSPELLSKEYGAAIVISGDRITIGGTEVTLTGNEGYEFQEWTGNCGKAEKQVCDEFIVYSHPDPIEFTGSNNIVITSEGYDLFSQSGYQKDFEISFDILNLNLTGSSKQATLLSVKNEDLNNQRPGISFRRKESTSNLELTARGGAATSVAKTYTASNVHSVKISREKGKLYIAINGGNKEEVDDYSNFTNYFDKPITIGSIYQNGGYDRYIKATLSNILIKTIDTTSCYTGNVYVVTGDCQMTAKFKEIEKHPDVTVNHHWMNIGGSGYTIHETQHFTGNIGDEFTAIENEYIGFTANPENEKTIIISGDNNSNVIDLYYFRNYGYFHFLYDPFSVRNIITSCEHGDCWYGEDIQLTVVEGSGYAFNSWGEPYGISLPEGVDRTSKTISFTMPEMTQQQIKWSLSLSAIPYTITYHLNGGEETTHNQTGYTVQNPIIEVIDPVMTGYEFLGWTGGIIGGEQLDSPTTGLVIVVDDGVGNIKLGNREYYANWTPNKYEVTGSVAEGQENMGYLSGSTSTGVSLTGLYEYGKELVFVAIPEIGYLFDYWEVNGNTGEDLPEGSEVTDNQLRIVVNQILDILAHFKENEKTVIINYYEMNTGGLYSNEPYYTDSLTGLVGQTKFINPESRIGFHLDDNRSNTGVTISENSEDNVINVYYERERYIIETSGRSYVMPDSTYIYFVNIIPDNQPYYQYYYGEEVRIESIHPAYGWIFSGWYDATSEGKGFPSDEVSLDSRNITFHMPDHSVWVEPIMEHIPYTLSFTGYEGAEITNLESCSYGTGDRETYYDYSECLPNLNKEGYWFNGWDDENGNWVRRYNEYSPDPILNRMPAHDYKLVANFGPRNNMSYEKYYYLQDIEGTGYTLSGDLTDWGNNDGITNQKMPGREPSYNIEGFQYSGFGYSGVMLPRDQWPYIKATGDNYINYYYDRNVYLVNVNYDNKKMSITGTGEYRYEAPVTLTATVKTGYSFSGFTSYQGELLSSDSVYNFTMPDSFVDIYADANPIEYSIEYEPNGGELDPYSSYANYTVESSDLSIGNPYKDGYKFLGWTGGVVSGGIEGEENIVEPTRDLIIAGGSIGDRKYYANWEPDEVKVTVNYYLKKIDSENNTLIDGVDVYLAGVEYTGLSDDIVNIFSRYGTGIEGYHYDHATVFSGEIEETATETTVLPDGSREINMYYIPNKYNFTVIQGQNTTTSGTSISTGYYFRAYVTLSGDSSDDCFGWDKWGSTDLPEGNNQQHTIFEMPAHDVTVESMVSEKSYNIVFSGNGATSGEMSTLSLQCTSGTLSKNNFERNGYTFTGWSRNSEGTVEFTGGSEVHRLSTISGGEVTLFAVWDVNHYTVTFDLNGGNLTGDMTETKDYTIETPSITLDTYIPERNGYTFTGWYKGDSLVNAIAGGETGNYTLIAKWEAQERPVPVVVYKKMLVAGEYSEYESELMWGWGTVGESYTAPIENFISTGFHYEEENENNRRTVIVDPNLRNEVAIFFDRNQYPLEIRNVGEGISSMTTGGGDYLYEEPVTINVKPFTGWEFLNWTLINGSLDGVDLNQQTLSFNMPAEEIKISPNLNHVLYTVSFDSASGTSIESQTYYYDDVLSGLDNAVTIRTGYDFAGWYLSGNLYTSSSKMPAENITLVAKWTPATGTEYKVEYYYQENGIYSGIATSGEIRTGTTEQLVNVTDKDKIPVVSGYIFDEEEQNILSGNIQGDGSLVLKVYFKQQFTIRYQTGLHGTFTEDVHSNLNYGVKTPIFRGNTGSHESGYTFNGWMPEITDNVTGSVDYVAQWKADTGVKYEVQHRLQNLEGTEYNLSGTLTEILSGETDTLVIGEYRNITGFSGNVAISGDERSGKIKGDGSLVLKLYYDRNEYEISTGEVEHGSINGGGGSQKYGKKITFTAHPNIGYVISKRLRDGEEILSGGVVWTGEELEIEVDTGMEIGIDFVARNDIPYYVEYYKENLEGGYDIWTGTYSGTTNQEAKAQEIKFTGFTFNSGDERNVTTGNIDGDGSRVLRLYYNREIYTIKWLNEDGTQMDTTSVKYGEIPTHAIPVQPADAHYTYEFKGWTPEPTFATGETSYRATYDYIVNKYTITWKNDDGSVIDTTQVEYGEIPTHVDPIKAETEDYTYEFKGWTPELVSVVGDAEYTAEFNAKEKKDHSKGGNMSGGGGRRSIIDNSKNSDNQHGSAEEDSDLFTGNNGSNPGNKDNEIISLYEWARENEITTMDTLEYANPDGLLTRGHMAKMAVNFAQNVLGKTIPTEYPNKCNWKDKESERESSEVKEYAKKACALGLMGIYVEEFMPNKVLDRAEFGTIISRLLWGDRYNITDTDHRGYYEDHLRALKKHGILSQTDNPEERRELRKLVWLVFRRISEKLKK